MRLRAWRVVTRRLILALSIVALLAAAMATAVAANSGARLPLIAINQQQPPADEITHVVGFGETLAEIARRYNLNIDDIIALNGLDNPNFIFVGQRLRLPPGTRRHTVQPGDTLVSIARDYDASLRDILTINNLSDPNLLYIDQELLIPAADVTPTPPPPATETATTGAPTAAPTDTATVAPTPTLVSTTAAATPASTTAAATPTPPPTPQPTATKQTAPAPTGVCLCPAEEEIIITGPSEGITVTSPILVTGIGEGFEQSLTVRVLDEAGEEIGIGPVSIAGEIGQRGEFSGTISYRAPLTSQWGRVQVYSVSPRDGAIEHLNSVSVRLLGSNIEAFLTVLRIALETKDYTILQTLMLPDSFLIGFYLSEGVSLTPAEAIEQLELNYLGPGDVTVRDDVDGWQLLGDRASFGPTVRLVLYSEGWGADAADDAFLIFEERDGEFYWTAMLYVHTDLRDYQRPAAP